LKIFVNLIVDGFGIDGGWRYVIHTVGAKDEVGEGVEILSVEYNLTTENKRAISVS